MNKIIGIYGGTFDPIHNGHLHVANTLLTELPFQEIRFIPCFEPVHRQSPIATPEQRLHLCELALENQTKLIVDSREIQREGKSFMIDTLKSLRTEFKDFPLALIIGADSLETFQTWKSWKQIIDYAHLLVVNRPESVSPQDLTLQDMIKKCVTTDKEKLNTQLSGLIYFAYIPPSPVSATKLRQQLSSAKDISHFVPKNVFDYIRAQHIYSCEPTAGL